MKVIDISGFGGSYEDSCQVMLLRGIKYLEDKPYFDWSKYTIATAESKEAKELDKVITEGIEPSGAMHQAVINHLAYIHKYGHDAWIAKAIEQDCEVHESSSLEALESRALIGQIEWQLKLDGGYNPMAELFKNIPMDDIIVVDINDKDSMSKAAEEIARRIQGP